MTLDQIIKELHENPKTIESMSDTDLISHLSKYFKVTRPTEEQIKASTQKKAITKISKEQSREDTLKKVMEIAKQMNIKLE